MSGDSFENIIEINKNAPAEDLRLINWSKWVDEWNNVGNKIAETLDVPQENILMNYGDDVRKINEEKLLLEYAKIVTSFDKYRGNPDFWKLPCSLRKKFKCCLNEPNYFATKTQQEKNEIPTLEFIGVPNFIKQTEKNIVYGTRNIYEKWQNSKYRQEQLEKYYYKIDKIVPHRPRLQNLIVVGQNLCKSDDVEITKSEELLVLERLESACVPEDQDDETSETEPPKLCLVINNIELNLNICNDCTSRKIHVNFEYDIKGKMPEVKYLTIQNSGVATLRILWTRLPEFKVLRNNNDTTIFKSQGFYFDKNELIILPNQKIEFPIWFQTESAGIYSERWELTTVPKIWKSNFSLMLVLSSYAYFGDLKQRVNSLIQYIDAQVRNSYIKTILNEIIEQNIIYHDKPVVSCVYDESQLFEIANLVNDRPLFLYDENVVNEVNKFYEQLVGKPNWNYCFKCIKKLAQSEDIATFLKNKEEEIANKIIAIQNNKTDAPEEQPKKKSDKKEKKRKSPRGDKKSKGKSPRKDKKSKKSQKSEEELVPKTEEIKRENYVYSNHLELCNLMKKFDSPVIINRQREKYFACTKIMSAYFTQMCQMLNSLERNYDIVANRGYPETKENKLIPISNLPDRLVYEYFEDDYLSNKPTEYYPGARRKPSILKDIPSDDVETIYTTYFKIEKHEPKTKGKKGKKGKEKKSKERSKSPKKKEKPKKGGVPKKEIKKESVQSFDPYAEQFTYKAFESQETDAESLLEDPLEIPDDMMESYKYRQYISVYSCLSQAVEALVDTIELFECTVPYSTINEVRDNVEDMEKTT